MQMTAQTIASVLNQTKLKLPALDAELLLACVMQVSRAYLHTWPAQKLTHEASISFSALVQRYLKGEPLAYLTGEREFWSLSIDVTPHTLIPRPETELLVEQVLSLFSSSTVKAADLGTGSGAIALALAKEQPLWEIVATDISADALMVAKANANRLGLQQIQFLQGNWYQALPHHHFDVIVSNPPYIALTEWPAVANGLAFEPYHALVSGEDGLDDIKLIITQAPRYLRSNGWLVLEHGYQQAEAVRSLFKKNGYQACQTLCDLAGHERVTLAQIG